MSEFTVLLPRFNPGAGDPSTEAALLAPLLLEVTGEFPSFNRNRRDEMGAVRPVYFFQGILRNEAKG